MKFFERIIMMVVAGFLLGAKVGEKTFYISGSQAESWAKSQLAKNPNDKDAKLVLEKIASQPQAIWLAGRIPGGLLGDAQMAKQQGARLLLVTYNIPNRDLGHYSAGGKSGSAEYLEWVTLAANMVGDTEAWYVIEPDAIGHAPKMEPSARAERYSMLSNSVVILKKHNKNARVYLAISGWNGEDGAVEGLKKSGIDKADGFAYNISGYHDLPRCYAFADSLSKRLGGKHYILDTSRNANGDWKTDDPEPWCNSPIAGLGEAPTFETGHQNCDAFAWIKRPGESDGEKRGPKAGAFSPSLAVQLCQKAKK